MSNQYYILVLEQYGKKQEQISFEKLDIAKHYSKVVLQEPNRIRCCHFFKADENNNIVNIAKMDRGLEYVEIATQTS